MLPFMRSKNQTKVYSITSFGGYNPGNSHSINETIQELNSSSEFYPALCSSKIPATEKTLSGKGLGGGFFDELYTIEYQGEETGTVSLCTQSKSTQISVHDTPESAPAPRTMEFMKDELLIIPDNMIYYTNTGEVKAGCASESTSQKKAQEKFEKESETTNRMPLVYNTWYSSYITGNSLVAMGANYRVSSTSYKFYHFGISEAFEIGDVVTLKLDVKPIDASQNQNYRDYKKKMADGISVQIKDLVKTTHSTPSGTITEYTEIHFDDNSIDMGGYDEVFVLSATIEKGIPNFVDICSLDNRMWGVTKNTIHASKLGDSSEWNDFTVDSYGTLPSSSFSTQVESDGEFTAISPFNGSIIAFKEDCIHKIHGDEPAEYTVTRIDYPGVAKGCKDTISVVNGILYYMGKDGVYAFNGYVSKLISRDVINPESVCITGAGDNRFYYIAARHTDTGNIYVYDTLYQTWHIRDSVADIVKLVETPEGIKIICETEICSMEGSYAPAWSFAFSIGEKEFSSKHICSFGIRYFLGENSDVSVFLKNKHGMYKLATSQQSVENGILSINIPVSCHTEAHIIFEGKGQFVLKSLDIRYKETGINY